MPDTTTDTPAAEDPNEVLAAVESFAAPGTHVAKGDRFRAGDPIVTGRRHLFEPVAATVRASVPGPVVDPPPFLEDDDEGGQDGASGADEGQADTDTPAKARKGGKAAAGGAGD